INIQGSFLVCQKKPSRWFFNLRHTLQFGIGLHHAGLNDKDGSLVEELFANNKIQAFLSYLSIGLYQHIGMGCKPSRSSSGHYKAAVLQDKFTSDTFNIDSSTGSIADFACEVEITKCETLPDGRFYLEIESRRRFRIISILGPRWVRYGYMTYIYPPEGSRERANYLFIDQRRLERLLGVEARMPSQQDPERFSF
ncbi:unnamed protein product, partial [Prunus armeniaca]